MKTYTYLSNGDKFVKEINVTDPMFPSAVFFAKELSSSISERTVCDFGDKLYGYLTDAYIVSDYDNGPVTKTIVFEVKPTMISDGYHEEGGKFTFSVDLSKYTLTGPGNSAPNKYEFTGTSGDYITILFRYE